MDLFHLKGSILILLTSLVLALAVNALSPAKIPLKGQWDPKAGVIMADPDKYRETRALELDNPLKLRRLIQKGNLVLLDVRQEFLYAQGHLPGALSSPLHEFDKNLKALRRVISQKQPVVVYCSGLTCQDSHKFARKLMAMGVKEVMVYGGGFEEWSEMGFTVVTGES